MAENRVLHYRYNLFYSICILIAVIVILLTVKWGAISELVKYITFGLTLTSLFLALIAIFYAIISNSSFSKHIGGLRAASDSVTSSAASLDRMLSDLEEKISELPGLIRGVEQKVDLTRKEISRSATEATPTDREISSSGPNGKLEGVEVDVKSFIDRSSFSGMLALHTVQLAYQTRKPFSRDGVWVTKGLEEEYGTAWSV